MITPVEITVVEIVSTIFRSISSRAESTVSIRGRIFDTKEICEALYAKLGRDGLKFNLISLNSVADSNQLHFLQNLTPEDAMELAQAYGALRQTNGASTGPGVINDKTSILAHTLYWSKELNKHPDSPYSDSPVFDLITNADSSVAVGDKVEI